MVDLARNLRVHDTLQPGVVDTSSLGRFFGKRATFFG